MNPLSTRPNRWRPITVFNLVLGLLLNLSALGQPAFLKEGLVAYYPFNGNANDESGNQFNGVIQDGIISTNRFGESNSSCRCDGKRRAVTVPNFIVSGNNISVSFWFNAANIDYAKGVRFLSHNWDGEKPYGSFGMDSYYGGIFRGTADADALGFYVRKEIPTNVWQHWVLTFNGKSTAFYTNGVFAGGENKSMNLRQSKTTLYIGGDFYFLNGDIDDVRIYNRALPDTEVKALYTYESTPPDNSYITNGLIAYYPFNGNANDESGNGNTGSIFNAENSSNRFGLPAAALKFTPEKASLVTIPGNSFPIGNNPITVSLWTRIENPKIITPFIKYPMFGADDGSNTWNFNLIYQPDGKTFTPNIERFENHNFIGAYLKWSLYPNYSSALNWHQIAIVFRDPNTTDLFLDGVLIPWGTLPTAATSFRPGGVFHIGSITSPGGNTFSGTIDDVRVYNRALFDGEVKALYKYEATPPIQSPVFVSQPVSQTVNSGDNVVLSIGLQAAGTYNYQWQLNEQNIAGATASSLSVNNAVAGVYRYRVIVSNSAGTVISDTANLTVSTPPAPTIATQPTPKTVQEGANVSLNVVAAGQGAIVYQWQFNEQNLPGATSATLNLNGVKLNTAGRYRVLVSSPYGVTISDTVTLTVNPNPPPTIVTQPLSRTSAEGTQVSLTVTATGLGNLTYQWQINNQNIPGATSSTLVLSAVRPSANGNYRVIVGNPYGTTISTEATVTVVVTDSDSDGLSDYEELLLGTNANKADSDGDGLSDFAEVRTHKSNPLTTDTDGDGYSDGIEVARDGNPNNRSVTPTGALAVFPAVDVEFYTLNSVKYQLEVSTDMVSWTAQGGVVVGNGGSQNHLVRASKATQFWRLKVVQ